MNPIFKAFTWFLLNQPSLTLNWLETNKRPPCPPKNFMPLPPTSDNHPISSLSSPPQPFAHPLSPPSSLTPPEGTGETYPPSRILSQRENLLNSLLALSDYYTNSDYYYYTNMSYDTNSTDLYLYPVGQNHTGEGNFTYPEYMGDYMEGGSDYDLHSDDRMFIFIIEGVILTTVSILGIIGTVMSIGVLVKKSVRESFSGLLTGLAICDTLFLFTSLIMFGLPKLWLWFAIRVTNRLTIYTFGFLHIWRVGSTYLTLSVTLERYCAICHPLSKAIKQRYLLLGSLSFAIVYNIPKFFEFRVSVLPDGDVVTGESPMRRNKYYQQFYVFWSKFILIELLPYFTIIVLNTLILMKTLKASRFRRRFTQQSTSHHSRHHRGSISESTNLTVKRTNNRRCSQNESVQLNHLSPAAATGNGGNGDNDVTTCFVDMDDSSPESQSQRGNSPKGGSPKGGSPKGGSPKGGSPKGGSPKGGMLLPGDTSRGGPRSETSSPGSRRDKNGSISNAGGKQLRSPSQTLLCKVPSSKITVTANKDKALGATLIGVSVLFLSCQSLKLIPDIYEGFLCGQDYCATNSVINTLITLSNLLMCINSAANFLMYMVRGTKFRRMFIMTYTGCCRK